MNAPVPLSTTPEATRPEKPAARREEARPIRVAVVGNPNTGKTTLFNALTGLRHRTANYPGVTIESAVGETEVAGRKLVLVDLPGSYSLAPQAPDELVAVEVLLGKAPGTEPPDVVLCVVDASNLERNLYLVSQVLEIGRPVVVALTMTDVARRQGVQIDVARLAGRLGVPVVPVLAHRRIGVERLRAALLEAATGGSPGRRHVILPELFERKVAELSRSLASNGSDGVPRFLLERLLLDVEGYVERELGRAYGPGLTDQVRRMREELARAGFRVPHLEVERRYDWIASVVRDVVRRSEVGGETWTDRIDRVVTHKVWGALLFLGSMALVFQAIFSWAVPLMDLLDAAFGRLGAAVGAALPEGPVRSLLVDGVIGGVGAVVVFLPQIAILFGLLTVLEDSGYMARAAFLMDRIMASFGLSGRSFLPLLSSFACAVPGIMSTRAIENRRDRLATILIAPLMSCSARLPVYVLFISAFVPAKTVWGFVGLQGLTLFSLYMLGLVVAPLVAYLLKRTLLRGPAVPFLLELPAYKLPSWRVVLFRMYDRSWAFLRRAGTIILASTILVWALSYYPAHREVREEFELLRSRATPEEIARLEALEAGERLRRSFLGRAGHLIEPVVAPLGWDWKIGMATIASFPAREVVIAALGTIYNVGSRNGEDAMALRDALRAERRPDGRPVFTTAVALSIMVFFALCCQCVATLATIRRETNSWTYPAFTFAYMTTLAYLGAFLAYRVGTALGL
ncbi:MAG: ferrous iron transporter B [Candidatus Binatia bacterium]|nr:MAG: ferrous iron transporter B [Candidatus Binatia bacterium]